MSSNDASFMSMIEMRQADKMTWDCLTIDDIQEQRQLLSSASKRFDLKRDQLSRNMSFVHLSHYWTYWLIQGAQKYANHTGAMEPNDKVKLRALFDLKGDRQLFCSLLNSAMMEVNSPLIHRKMLTMYKGQASYCRQNLHLCFLLETIRSLPITWQMTNMSDEAQMDAEFSKYLILLVRQWQKMERYDPDWNPVQQIIEGAWNVSMLESFAANKVLETLCPLTMDERIVCVKKLIMLSPVPVGQYIADHIPSFASETFAACLESRQLNRPEQAKDFLRESDFITRAPKMFRMIRSKNMHTAMSYGKRSREQECCVICMDDDKEQSQLLRCGHCMCQECLVEMGKRNSVKCAVCKQPAIPLYVEQVPMSSKIARLDVVDTSNQIIGSIDMKEADMMHKSSQLLEVNCFPVFDLVATKFPSKVCYSKKTMPMSTRAISDRIEWIE